MLSTAAAFFEAWIRADELALSSLIIGVVAAILAVATLHRGNKNSSVASMIPLNAEIRELWEDYLSSFPSQTEVENASVVELALSETKIETNLERLMNVLEISAAIEVEGTLTGVSRTLMRDYLRRVLSALISDDYTSNKISTLLQDQNTFIFIRRFLGERENLSVVLPPHWYAYPKVGWWERARRFFRY